MKSGSIHPLIVVVWEHDNYCRTIRIKKALAREIGRTLTLEKPLALVTTAPGDKTHRGDSALFSSVRIPQFGVRIFFLKTCNVQKSLLPPAK